MLQCIMVDVHLNGNVNIGLVLLQSSLKHVQVKFVYCLMQEHGTPLHGAAYLGAFDVVQLLIDMGADVNAFTKVILLLRLMYVFFYMLKKGRPLHFL